MFEVKPTVDVDDMIEALSDLERTQVPFATVVALTRTAFDVAEGQKKAIESIFIDPVDFTTGSIKVDKATKADPRARVDFKDERVSPGHYLRPHVDGGGRRHTPFEGALIAAGVMLRSQFAVPLNGADRDGSGNLNPGQIGKILADLAANAYAVKSVNYRNKGVRRAETYFVPRPGSSLKAGIYLRLAGQTSIVPVFAFTTKAPNYSRVYPFVDIAQRIVDERYPEQFTRALEDAVRTSNYKGKWSTR